MPIWGEAMTGFPPPQLVIKCPYQSMLQLIVYRNEQFCHHEKVMIDIGLPSFTSSEYGFPVIIANIFCNTGNSSPSYF